MHSSAHLDCIFQMANLKCIFWTDSNSLVVCDCPRTSEEMDGTLPRIASFEIHSRGDSYYTLGLDGGWFLGPWAFIILESSYQDLSNEVHWNLFFKLFKHRINFRFWLVWLELRKSKALSSLNFLKRHGKYQIGSCPQLLYA